MHYLLLIYAKELELPEMGGALQQEYQAFNAALGEAGVFVGANRLALTHDAKTQRVRDGAVLTTDGPFAETKEQLAGYYLLDCADHEEALAWAARMPAARIGSIEVRPVMS